MTVPTTPGDVYYYGDAPGGNQATYTPPTSTVITKYYNATNKYPANNQQWWPGKATVSSSGPPAVAVGDFEPSTLQKIFFGNGKAPRGHFVVNAFDIDRAGVSGIVGLTEVTTKNRPTSCTFFAGRIWFAGDNTVYFSQIIDDKSKIGKCYQDADPTSEIISDLVATDGGVIPIPEATNIVKLLPQGGGILVFANNGVWYVSGGQGGFTATDIAVSKINSIGTDSPGSIVESGTGTTTQVYWWSRVGIQAMQQTSGSFGAVSGKYDQSVISDKTIRTFYNQITDQSKAYVKGAYDPASNTIQWIYKSSDITIPYHYNRVLNYDITLQAFYPWSISEDANSSYITGIFVTPTLNTLVDVAGNTHTEVRPSFIKYTCKTPAYGFVDNWYFTFGYDYDDNFQDWGRLPYTSYLETGYELLSDAMRNKQTPYVFCYFRQTEEQMLDEGDSVVLNHPSSCLFTTKWDWSNSSNSNRWSRQIEAYRLTTINDVSVGTFDSGFSTVVSKNKVRGQGRAIQFRFEGSAIGKDFDILGWSVSYSGVTKP